MNTEAVSAGNALVEQLAIADWLGPLAPIAISPFFGLAMLSGVACFAPASVTDHAALLHSQGPLANYWLFGAMALLALLTSLPRLTKVSKPIALVAENLETYSAIIIFVVLRLAAWHATVDAAPDVTTQSMPAEAGIASFSLSLLMAAIAAFNIIVINVVKLSFEFLVWLIPVPAVDAVLEAVNKTLCVALTMLYVFSPTLAALINLLLFAASLLVFGWCYRRLHYYREIVTGPLLARMLPGWFAQRGEEMRVYSEQVFEGLPAFTVLRLRQVADSTYEIHGRWLWKRGRKTLTNGRLYSESGVLATHLQIAAAQGTFHFKHRHWVPGDACYRGDIGLAAADA